MHETHLISHIFQFLEDQEKALQKRIRKVHVSIAEFGTITEEHLREHFKEGAAGTKWEFLALEVNKIPFGSELEITKIEFD